MHKSCRNKCFCCFHDVLHLTLLLIFYTTNHGVMGEDVNEMEIFFSYGWYFMWSILHKSLFLSFSITTI